MMVYVAGNRVGGDGTNSICTTKHQGQHHRPGKEWGVLHGSD